MPYHFWMGVKAVLKHESKLRNPTAVAMPAMSCYHHPLWHPGGYVPSFINSDLFCSYSAYITIVWSSRFGDISMVVPCGVQFDRISK